MAGRRWVASRLGEFLVFGPLTSRQDFATIGCVERIFASLRGAELPKNKKWKNPFYTLLIPAGAAFCVTGFAYGFMAFQQVNAGRAVVEQSADHPLFQWLEAHGTTAMLVELGVLAVLTVGAIGTDDWWASEDSTTDR